MKKLYVLLLSAFILNTLPIDVYAINTDNISSSNSGIDAVIMNEKKVSIPIVHQFKLPGSLTSVLHNIPESNLISFKNLVLDIPSYGSIYFTSPINLSNKKVRNKFKSLDKFVKLGKYFVEIDSNKFPELNIPAKIIFRNVIAEAHNEITVLRNGQDAGDSVRNFKYNPFNNEVTFDVQGFSKYELSITDEDMYFKNIINENNTNNAGLILMLIFISIAVLVYIVLVLEKHNSSPIDIVGYEQAKDTNLV